MEDFSNKMMPGKPVSPKMRAMLDKEKNEARKRIIERGIVHFRADKEFMTALLDAAEQQKVAPGALCRQVVWEYLKSLQSPLSKETTPAELPSNISETLLNKLDAIQTLLSTPDTPNLVREIRRGQDEIRGELRDMHSYLRRTTKK